jgi:ABC-type polysaccharide/polyol phosphate export permease
MTDSAAPQLPRSPTRAVVGPWVHRSPLGVETGGETPAGKPGNAIPAFLDAVSVAWHLRETLWVLVLQDFKGRYRAQSLGLFWSLAHPLVMMLSTTIAFKYVLRLQIEFFPVFYLIGAIFWQFFSNTLTATTGSILNNGGIIKRTNFPRFLFPVSTVLSNFIPLAMELFLVFGFFFLFPGAYHFGAALLALPLLAFLLILMLIGVGFITSVLNVKYRDLYYLVTSVVAVAFWGTPVLYSTAMAPGWLRPLLRLNPVGGIIEGARDVIMHGEWPSAEYVLPAAVTGVIVFIVGCVVFRRQNLEIADYL